LIPVVFGIANLMPFFDIAADLDILLIFNIRGMPSRAR